MKRINVEHIGQLVRVLYTDETGPSLSEGRLSSVAEGNGKPVLVVALGHERFDVIPVADVTQLAPLFSGKPTKVTEQ